MAIPLGNVRMADAAPPPRAPPRPLFFSYIVFSFMSVLFDVLPFILAASHRVLVSSCMDSLVAI